MSKNRGTDRRRRQIRVPEEGRDALWDDFNIVGAQLVVSPVRAGLDRSNEIGHLVLDISGYRFDLIILEIADELTAVGNGGRIRAIVKCGDDVASPSASGQKYFRNWKIWPKAPPPDQKNTVRQVRPLKSPRDGKGDQLDKYRKLTEYVEL